jgi:hypothetical protein
LEKWFFENDDFANKMEEFAMNNCDVFDVDSTEQKLEYTTVYNEFRALFEKELEGFVTSQGVTPQEFSQVAQKEATNSQDGDTPFKWIVATSDYEVFLQMMQDEKRKKMEK